MMERSEGTTLALWAGRQILQTHPRTRRHRSCRGSDKGAFDVQASTPPAGQMRRAATLGREQSRAMAAAPPPTGTATGRGWRRPWESVSGLGSGGGSWAIVPIWGAWGKIWDCLDQARGCLDQIRAGVEGVPADLTKVVLVSAGFVCVSTRLGVVAVLGVAGAGGGLFRRTGVAWSHSGTAPTQRLTGHDESGPGSSKFDR